MPTIKKGTYRFNDVLIAPSDLMSIGSLNAECNIFCDGVAYNVFGISWLGGDNDAYCVFYANTETSPALEVPIYANADFSHDYIVITAGWQSTEYQTITITQDQDVTDEFYTWFTANAKPIIKAGTYKFIDKPAMLGEYNFLGLDFSSRSIELNVTQEMANEINATLKEMVGNEFPIANAGLYNITFHYGGFDGLIEGISYEKTDVLPTVQPFDEGFQLFLGFTQSRYEGAYNIEQGWESDEKRYIVVEQDQEVTELTHQWFTANATEATVIIKAGTYKFNDVLDIPDYIGSLGNGDASFLEQSINFFGVADNIKYFCDRITVLSHTFGIKECQFNIVSTENSEEGLPWDAFVYSTSEGGWKKSIFGENIQTITITKDTAVSAEFAEWFAANTVEQRKIGGVWKFSDNIFCYPYERYHIPARPEEKIDFLKTYGALCKPVDLSSIQEGLYANCFSMANSFGDMYVDGQPTVFYSGIYIGMCADGEYTGIDVMSVEHFYDQTVDFGTKSQYVSLDFYNWLTENAVEQKQIVGKWRFNETIDASIMNSEEVQFTVTTKYLVDGIIYTGYGTKISTDNGTMAYYIDHSVPPDPDELLSDWIYIYGTNHGIDNVWTPNFDSNVRVVDFGTEPQYVSAYFYNWFTNNANKILEIKMKDLFFNYNESQAQVGYKSAVLYKKQGDTKYRFLCASESVPFPYGTKDTFEYDLLNSSSKGLAEGKNTLEQKEVELLYTPNNAYLFEQLKGQVLDFMSLTPDRIGYKYHGTISFRPNDATADIHRGTYTITPMGASEVPYFMARKECYAPLFFADVIPYEISLAELGDAESVALNLGLVGNYKEAVYKYDTFSETTNRFSGTSNEITVTNGVGTIPKNAGLYLITAEPKETDKTTHSGCFTLVYITD